MHSLASDVILKSALKQIFFLSLFHFQLLCNAVLVNPKQLMYLARNVASTPAPTGNTRICSERKASLIKGFESFNS